MTYWTYMLVGAFIDQHRKPQRGATPGHIGASAERPNVPLRHLSPERHRWKPIPSMHRNGHSPLVPAYGMPYRSLHRSAQEAAMWPNSRAQRRIRWASRRSATAPQPRMPSAEAHPNLKHARWTSTTRVQDAIQKPPSTGAGRRGAAQLQGAAAHPLSAQARRDGTSAPDAIGGSPSQACAVDTRNLLTGYRAEAAPFR